MQKYAKHVGLKRDFRLVVRGAARNMVKILNGSSKCLSFPFFLNVKNRTIATRFFKENVFYFLCLADFYFFLCCGTVNNECI